MVQYKLLSLQTGIGDIPTDFGGFMSYLAGIAIGIGGLAAMGLLIAGAVTILTSTGEPEKLLNGREMITNALTGLALIVLALFILEFLGWGILGIDEIRIVTGG